jgi:xanthine dehydrogenase small subunit
MSLWALYAEHASTGTKPSLAELRSGLTGNLCRCTGYRPILDAGLADARFAESALRPRRAQGAARIDRARGIARLRARGTPVLFAPRTLAELLELRAAHPQATILAGNTDVGLWVTKQLRDLPEILYIGNVGELKIVQESNGKMRTAPARR